MLSLNITNGDSRLRFYTPIFRIYKDTITESANLPTVVGDMTGPFNVYFTYNDNLTNDNSYAKQPYRGQTSSNDFDQYALYYVGVDTAFTFMHWGQLDVTNLGGANYFSMNWLPTVTGDYSYTAPNDFFTCIRQHVTQTPTANAVPYSLAFDYVDDTGSVSNPFALGNRATACYDSNWTDDQSEGDTGSADAGAEAGALAHTRSRVSMAATQSQLGVYRPSKDVSGPFDDCFKSGNCAPTYLYVPMNGEAQKSLKYGIFRIKTPTVYIGDECVDTGEYDVQYYSLSCILDTEGDDHKADSKLLPYWTVNGRMLSNINTPQGYAYVVWAPHDEVVARKANPQPGDIVTKEYEPAIVTTKAGHHAYLLQQSDYYYNFRFQEANPNWEGNPVNAPCTVEMGQPITDELGDWCPVVTASTDTPFF